MREFMAVHGLNALLGSLDRPGGVFGVPADPVGKTWPVPFQDATSRRGAGMPRVDGTRPEPYGLIPGLYPEANGDKGAGYDVEVLMVLRSNPFYAMPGLGAFLDKAKDIPFVVSFGSFIDETSMAADLILPEHHPLERLQANISSQGTPYRTFRVSVPVIKPLARTKEAGDAIIETARLLGSPVAESFPWANMEEALQATMTGLLASASGGFADPSKPVHPWDAKSVTSLKKVSSSGELWAGLKKGWCWVDPAVLAGRGVPGFGTPSSKFEFYSGALRKARPASKDEACLPGYEPLSTSQREALSLIVYDDPRIQPGDLHTSPYMTKIIDDTVLLGDDLIVEIHPETAAKEGVAEGNRVEIRSSTGAIEARLHLFEGVMPGIVLVPAGLGHRACGRYLEGRGANPGEVVEIKRDPVSGLPVSKETGVRLTKV
ncbi:molybdopterin dinucleotide binding domain-containing protein [Thermodesulfobacteriota bacterium]